jgi:hypothetical protein
VWRRKPKIAISYRRADSLAITGRIYDHLKDHFGKQSVFRDLDAIPLGVDFRQHIDQVLRQSDALLVIVGPDWVGATGQGLPRIQEESDPVRVEVETALALNTRLIPVLVGDAIMPDAKQLPPTLSEFAYRNALNVDAGQDFDVHINRLIDALREVLGMPSRAAMSGGAPANPGDALSPRFLLSYVALPIVLLLLAYYLFVIKLDLHTFYLRLAATVVPLLFGFLLFWRARHGSGVALAVAAGIALGAVAGMHAVAWMIEGVPLVPTEPIQWQTAFEFVAAIALSVVGGYLGGHLLRSAGVLPAP